MNGLQFDHIGLVVSDMADGRASLEEMFGVWPEDNPMLIMVKAL